MTPLAESYCAPLSFYALRPLGPRCQPRRYIDENRARGCRSTLCAFGTAGVSLGTKTAASMLRRRSVHKLPLLRKMLPKMALQLAHQAAYLQTSRPADLLAVWEVQ